MSAVGSLSTSIRTAAIPSCTCAITDLKEMFVDLILTKKEAPLAVLLALLIPVHTPAYVVSIKLAIRIFS